MSTYEDLTEEELLGAIKSATSADEAESLFDEATRRVKESKDGVRSSRAAELRAERKWGELLGEADRSSTMKGNSNAVKNSVSAGDTVSHADRIKISKARAVFRIDPDVFEAYVTEAASPSRAGLLRIDRMAKAEQAIKELMEAIDGKVPSIRSVARKLGLDDDRTLRKDWDALAGVRRAPARPVSKDEREQSQSQQAKEFRVKNWNGMSNAQRNREIKAEMRRRGTYNGYFDLLKFQRDISQLCWTLEQIRVEDYDFSDLATTWSVEGVMDDLATHFIWVKRTLAVMGSRVDDKKALDRIAKIRAKAASTTFAPEAEAAHALADLLERNRENKLEAND